MIFLDIIPQGAEDFGQEIASAWPIIVAIGFLLAGLAKYIKQVVKNEISPLKEEFVNNTGSSMREAIDGLEDHLKILSSRLDGTREEFQSLVIALRRDLDQTSLESGRAAFRQSFVASETPAYEIFHDDASIDGWAVKWTNNAYKKLTGLNSIQILEGEYWTKNIHPDDQERIWVESHSAGDNAEQMIISYRHINAATQEECNVEVYAWPLLTIDGKVDSYFGVIKVLDAE